MSYIDSHLYVSTTEYDIRSCNPFNKYSTEYRICDDLLKLTNQCIKKEDALDDSYLLKDNKDIPRLPANPAFVKRLINKFSFSFSVSMLEYEIFRLLPAPSGTSGPSEAARNAAKDTYERFDMFIEKMIPILEAFHYHYLKYIKNEEPRKRKHNKEAIIRILLSAASNDSAKPMNQKELLFYVNNQLLDIPRELNEFEIYADYKSHLPKKVIKTKTTIKRPFKIVDTQGADDIRSNPWSSPYKTAEHFERNGWQENEIDNWKQQQLTDYFNQKEQSKKYMLKVVAPRHSFIIDYFFPGDFIYLLAININTRKAYAIPPDTTKEVNKERYIRDEKGNKTAEQAVKLLNKLIKEAKNVKHILCDQEGAFMSTKFKDACKKRKIELKHYIKNHVEGIIETTDKARGIHNTLSLIDRLSRTLRKMNYNIGNNANINPKIMEYLINEYNNSPHATLSKIIGSPITPNIVNEIPQLEDFIVEQLMKENIKIKLRDDYNIVGKWCRCVNESSKFDKIKNKLLPGIWKVVGSEDGLFKCRQFIDGKATNNYIKLPRMLIKVMDTINV